MRGAKHGWMQVNSPFRFSDVSLSGTAPPFFETQELGFQDQIEPTPHYFQTLAFGKIFGHPKLRFKSLHYWLFLISCLLLRFLDEDLAQQPAPWDVIYGAVHAGDIPFIFGDFGRGLFSCGLSTANEPGRLALSNAMQKSIAAFVRTGDPNNPSLGIQWEKAVNGSTGKPKKIVFDADKTSLKISTTNN